MAKTPTRRTTVPATIAAQKRERRKTVRFGSDVALEICERLAQGEPWRQITKDEHMPSYPTFYDWQDRHPEFAAAVTRARTMAADSFADQMLEVADTVTSGTASGDRVKVGIWQWRAAKAAPHLYGRMAEERAETRRVIVTVRKFEEVVGSDGETYLREIPRLPEDKR